MGSDRSSLAMDPIGKKILNKVSVKSGNTNWKFYNMSRTIFQNSIVY